MSIALICDRCGTPFPEGQEGSFTGSGGAVVREGRRQVADQRRVDICPLCYSPMAVTSLSGTQQLTSGE